MTYIEKGMQAMWEKNLTVAYREFMKSAEAGEAVGWYNVGVMHRRGCGVPQDNKKAVEYWEIGAKLGDADAQLNLGLIYREGEEGIPKNPQKALKYLLLAANQGRINAMLLVSHLYYCGDDGVQRDVYRAYVWSNIAFMLSQHKMANEDMERCGAEMSSEKIKEAQAEAVKWIKDNLKIDMRG